MPSFQKAYTSFMCVKHKTDKTLAPQSNYTSHRACQCERWIIIRKVSMMSHADKYSIKTKQGKKARKQLPKDYTRLYSQYPPKDETDEARWLTRVKGG